MQNAGKVGALVVAFGLLLIGAYSVLGRSLFGTPTARYYASFKDAAGLSAGTRVLMAGVKVGTVSEVLLVDPGRARVTMELARTANVPQGTKAVIPSSLTGIGEQVLHLIAPSGPAANLPERSELVGVTQKPLDNFLPSGEDAVAELTKTMAAFRKLLEDDGLINQVKELMATTSSTMAEFGKTAGSVNGLIVRNGARFDASMASAAATMGNVKRLSDEMLAIAKKGNLQKDLGTTMTNIKLASAEANRLMNEFTALVSDPEMKASLKKTTANFAQLSESGVTIGKSGETIAANVETMTADGTVMSKNVVELTEKLNKLADQLGGLLDDAKGTLKKVDGSLGSLAGRRGALGNVETRFDLIQELDPSFIRTDFTAIFPQGDGGSFQVGLFNAFESNQLIAQIGKRLDERLGVRYGIFASKPAIGVDYELGPRASIRGDLFSLNDPRFDLRLRYDFGQKTYGWFGVNRMFKDNTPILGIGVRR